MKITNDSRFVQRDSNIEFIVKSMNESIPYLNIEGKIVLESLDKSHTVCLKIDELKQKLQGVDSAWMMKTDLKIDRNMMDKITRTQRF